MYSIYSSYLWYCITQNTLIKFKNRRSSSQNYFSFSSVSTETLLLLALCMARACVFLRACARAFVRARGRWFILCFFPPSLCQLIQFLFSQMQSGTPSTVGLKRKLWVRAKCTLLPPPKKKNGVKKKPSHTSRRARAHHRHIGGQSTKVRQTGLSGPDGRAGSADTLNNLTLTSAVNGDKCWISQTHTHSLWS